MRKLFILLITILLFVLTVPLPASAQNILSREDLNFDESLSDQRNNTYSYFDSVGVIGIQSGSNSSFGDGKTWMRGLYYFMITHLGFLDIPFHYVVTWQGDVYEGRAGGYEVNTFATFDIAKDYSNTVLIAYFDNGRGMTNQGESALSELVEKLMGSFMIEMTDVFAADFEYQGAKEGNPSSLRIVPPKEGYLMDWNDTFIKSYKEGESLQLELSGNVEDISYSDSVNSWDDVKVRAIVKNTGEYNWYNSGPRATYLATSSPRGRNSDLYHPEVWSSFSRAVTPTEEVVLPGKSATFEFLVKAPIVPDKYTEKFELIRLPSSWINGTSITMSLNVNKTNLQLARILETGIGTLAVRECPGTGCKKIGSVETGYVTIVRAEQSGWYKIVYDSVNEGWVFGKYVKKI